MLGRKPNNLELKRFQKIIDLNCIVCRLFLGKETPPQIHHIEGSVKEGAHLKTIGLCFYHHMEGGNKQEYVSRHPHKAEFENRYGSEYKLLEITNNLIGE